MPMPRIDDYFLDCVFYLYPPSHDPNSSEVAGGTGFFVDVIESVPAKPPPGYKLSRNERYQHPVHNYYAVTCEHVIRDGNTIIRLNNESGTTVSIPLTTNDWISHPNGDDVAVCPVSLSESCKYTAIRDAYFVEKNRKFFQAVGPGDDVFMVGRYIEHEGKYKNLPVVRFGNIAMMPHEHILQWEREDHKQESFLVDMRSISGFSGSPVFSYNPQISDDSLSKSLGAMMEYGHGGHVRVEVGSPQLLGIDWGRMLTSKDVRIGTLYLPAGSNTGISPVVPAWIIRELLYSERVVAARRAASTEYVAQNRFSGKVNIS